eukprot:CAMPEP_0202388386 /NCGR_PEP_ID=MMETSP1127-20130417/77216_1 /ASSEMBLY_ACC=CAM_ASM_000462 /TAXON_ID=3047 /ORGANISM="Dunaliella tertiolecta, Strain CCMP1320" /LENGTH=67 /DNA_ID=CAMNT_0048989779 /DNA_START=1258 /DNA_END=1461 /DNA_ORIENTATION=+
MASPPPPLPEGVLAEPPAAAAAPSPRVLGTAASPLPHAAATAPPRGSDAPLTARQPAPAVRGCGQAA